MKPLFAASVAALLWAAAAHSQNTVNKTTFALPALP
jgi:hypothetical protein